MTVVDTGADLTRWAHDVKLSNKRRLALKRLRARLLAPQPAEKRIRKRYKDMCEWEVGEVIAYRLVSGRIVLLRVVHHVTDPLGTSPVCELLDWIGSEPPTKRVLKRLRVRSQDSIRWPLTSQFSILRTSEKELPLDRVGRLGVKLKPSAPSAASSFFYVEELR